MSLADLQRALGCRVAAASSPGAFGDDDHTAGGLLDLTAAETAWLRALDGSPGLTVTAHVARWWRETKIHMMARLTVTALRRTAAPGIVDRYLDETPCRTLFFVPEVVGFLTYVATCADVSPVAQTVARFERALLEARELAATAYAGTTGNADSDGLRAAYEIVAFPAPPEALLGALLSGADLPAASTLPTHVEVSPALPKLWRIVAP